MKVPRMVRQAIRRPFDLHMVPIDPATERTRRKMPNRKSHSTRGWSQTGSPPRKTRVLIKKYPEKMIGMALKMMINVKVHRSRSVAMMATEQMKSNKIKGKGNRDR